MARMPGWLTLRLVAAVAIPLALVAVIVIALTGGFGHTAGRRTASPAASGSNTTSTGVAKSAGDVPPVPSPTPEVDPAVRSALSRFVGAYYRIAPGDTTDTVKQHVMSLGIPMAQAALSSMDFTVYPGKDGTPALLGALNPDLVASDVSKAHDGSLWYVRAQVAVSRSQADARTTGTVYVRVGTVWQRQTGGTWIMNVFADSGGWK